MASTELSVLFTSKGNLQNELSGLRKELQGVQKDIKAATDAGDTGKVDALSRDYQQLEGRIAATREELKRTNSAIKSTSTEGVKSTGKLQAAWKKLQGIMKNPLFTAATIAGVTLFGKKAVEAFAQAEQSQMKLVEAYRKFGNLSDVPIQSIRDLASELQSMTGTDDDMLAAAAATLARFNLTGTAIKEVLPLVNDYAILTGRDVVSASESIGKALLGNARALKELGINFKSTGDTGKDFEGIMAALEEKAGGVGKAYGETTQGGLDKAKAAFSDLQEVIGEALVPALKALVSVVEPVAKFFIGLPGPIRGVAIAVGFLSTAVLALGPRIATMVIGLKAAGVEATAMKGKMAAAGTAVRGMLGPIGLAITALTIFWTAEMDAQAAGERLADTFDKVTGSATDASKALLAEEFLKNFSAEELADTPFTLNEITTAALAGGEAYALLKARIEEWGRQSIIETKGASVLTVSAFQNSVDAAYRDARAAREIAAMKQEAAKATEELADETIGVTRQLVVLGRTLPLASYKAADYYRALVNAKAATDALTTALSDLSAATSEWGARDNFKKSLKDFIEEPTRDAARTMISNMETAANAIKDPGERAQFTVDAIGKIEKAVKSEGLKLPKGVRDALDESKASADRVLASVKLVDAAIRKMPDSKTIKFFLETYGRAPAGATDAGAGPSDGRNDWNGGYVQGPGTATSDSIRKRLSNGEFVMRAAAVKAIGVESLYRMNREKAVDPALLERAQVSQHQGPLIGQVIVNNPGENVDVEAAVATALRRAERRRKERS